MGGFGSARALNTTRRMGRTMELGVISMASHGNFKKVVLGVVDRRFDVLATQLAAFLQAPRETNGKPAMGSLSVAFPVNMSGSSSYVLV